MIDIAQEAPDTIILAEDEASLYLQATTKVVWYPQGQTPIVKVDPGRACLHYYGTLNLHTGQEIVMPTKIMNASITALYLEKLLHAYPERPLLLLWDRAPWHRGPAIQQVLAANPRLEICFFPPAAPDLNPQEHVWKAARETVSHNHQIDKLDDLANRFERFLTNTTFYSSLLDKLGFNLISPMFI